MKHSRIKKFLVAGALLLTSGVLSLASIVPNVKESEFLQSSAAVDAYYSSLNTSLSGESFRQGLNSLNSTKRKTTPGYDGLRTKLIETDIDPVTNNFIGFYDNSVLTKKWDSGATWNREHTWPNSKGGSAVEGDLHMTRPTSVKINSDRGNKYYSTTQYDPGQFDEYYRGVAARIIFYASIAATELIVVDANTGGNNQMGKLSDLLKWNLQYLPTTNKNSSSVDIALRVEANRNDQAESIQGNRNPFIDHPEYACKIWGNTNDSTRAICGAGTTGGDTGGGTTGGETGGSENNPSITVSLNMTSYRLFSKNYNGGGWYVDLVATTSAPTTVTWSSSDTSIATVTSSGRVTGFNEGTATITATTSTGSFATCLITVSDNTSNGCGGSIIASSSIVFAAAIIGSGLLIYKKKKENE